MLIITTERYHFLSCQFQKHFQKFYGQCWQSTGALRHSSKCINWCSLVNHDANWIQYFWKAIYFSFCFWILLQYSIVPNLYEVRPIDFFFVISSISFSSRKCFSMPFFLLTFCGLCFLAFNSLIHLHLVYPYS